MGITGLWPFFKPVGEKFDFEDFNGLTVGIDGPVWILQATRQSHPVLRLFFFRISKLLRVGAKVVVVFDGETHKLKEETVKERQFNRKRYESPKKKKTSSPTGLAHNAMSKTSLNLITLLESMGVSWLQSRGESEALLAKLNSQRIIDVVITEDVDAFLFGALRVIRNFSICATSAEMRSYRLQHLESHLNLNSEKLVALGGKFQDQGDAKWIVIRGQLST
jgi:Holliday junction resolvase YEN1